MKSLYGVIGAPIAHSMSPLIHNDAFFHHEINAHYHAFHVEKNELKAAVDGMKALGAGGFNVTIPHKEAILPLLDEVDIAARKIGAVNTVVNHEGRFIGYNTDGQGYVRALKEKVNPEGKNILIIGAGGAARAILYTLAAEKDVHITVCNRTAAKAQELLEEFGLEQISTSLTVQEAQGQLSTFDIVIQTTSVGMYPAIDESPFPNGVFREGAIVSDIIYNPLKTKLLQDAEQQGAFIQNGVGMFVYQAALAFELWTGTFSNTKKMEQIVLDKLGGKPC
ncbi:Shikimate dehydrogenase [Bacillus sp. THAF10]|uniref:shikimate dehydrogenase n=1 Tax=Bacillus sp. THAF10 TaxID=2587848 RepID=UPI0012688562|nr:shikimate dehydrogenase [Bacillus sp. THAF10]QFT89932.1 Shikimate dehydrogenase [Bacillus sp. THAF10]